MWRDNYSGFKGFRNPSRWVSADALRSEYGIPVRGLSDSVVAGNFRYRFIERCGQRMGAVTILFEKFNGTWP